MVFTNTYTVINVSRRSGFVTSAKKRFSLSLVTGQVYAAEEVQSFVAKNDLQSVAEWMDVPLQDLVFIYQLVPISVFAKQAEEMLGTYEEFPQDKKRTDKIVKLIKQQPLYPVFVEEGDVNNFIMEGRHRIVAFWQAGMQQVPVFYVRVMQ